MSSSILSGVRVFGVSCALPDNILTPKSSEAYISTEDISKITASTGVDTRHVVKNLCTSDLCFEAANRLFEEGGFDRDDIDTVIFITQTPDYVLPASACVLQNRLGLSKSCAAFDVNLGCSGYVYGLWLASNLIAAGGSKNTLLLVGDTISKVVSPEDRGTGLLFGDAGSATILVNDSSANKLSFVLGSDGSGSNNLIVPAGGFRKRATEETGIRKDVDGSKRSDEDLFMNGAEIFAFTLREVKKLVKETLGLSNTDGADIDYYLFHQANKFMLKHLAKGLKLSDDKVPLVIEKYGNTSSASIPLIMCDEGLAPVLRNSTKELVLAGFGVGYSWAGVKLTTSNLVIPSLAFIEDK